MRVARARRTNTGKKNLPPAERGELLRVWQARFEKNVHRHKGLAWPTVAARLEANAQKTVVLQ